ncbi:insulinase family protein [Nocardioides antri]|uniref:Insulinase family protein n=1 Tax=Nocardioides antri TaxID=2607659 RepID=A0A5B1M0L2_9ACTN|nr:insulinase family protein [Nocardioides antri]KAA1425639.1 insulinase family protein [Nocardioides antri]
MTTLHDTEVDGVRCFWVDTGRPTLAARLAFRSGIADEDITESGWQHLIEHAALDRFPRGGTVDINGHVTLTDTAFDFHGDGADVGEHLARLTRWLAAPAFERLDHEIGVLRAEADVRGSSPLARALSWRYGARGPGLAAYAEPGLGRASQDELAERVGRVFTVGNAVLILDGPPPPDLRIELPAGDLRPLVEAVPVESPPAAYEEGSGIVVSGTVPREGPMFVGVEVLQRVLVERLRHEEGGAYAPWTNYERVDRETAVVTAGSDIRPELTAGIVDTTLGLLDELAAAGPREEWVTETVDRIVRGMRDPYAAIGVAMGAGMRYLHGREPETLDQMVERVRATTVAGLAEGFGQVRESVLLGAPPGTDAQRRLRMLQFPRTAPAASGRAFRSINWPADTSRLRLADHAIQVSDEQSAIEARYDDVVGLMVHEDGARTALRADGYSVTVDPRVWTDGHRAVDEIDSRVPAARHLPHPPLPGDAPQRAGLLGRWWPAVRRRLSSPRATYVGVLGLYLLFAVGFVGSMIKFGGGPTGIVVIALVWGAVAVHRALREGLADSS